MTSRSVQWPLASLIWLAGRTARRHAIGNDRYPQAGGPLPVGRADLSTARAPAPLHYRMAIDAPPAGWPRRPGDARGHLSRARWPKKYATEAAMIYGGFIPSSDKGARSVTRHLSPALEPCVCHRPSRSSVLSRRIWLGGPPAAPAPDARPFVLLG